MKATRRFALYVSGTQDQADKHVQAVGSFFETVGIARAVNRYGSSKGWRRDQLRTSNGFNVAAYGLDTAARGVKLDQYRPDLLIFDDVDSVTDSSRTIEKKIDAITTSILPAGSSDCAVLVIQNAIHEESIVSMLVDGRADFLHNRETPQVEPAVHDLQVTTEPQEDGSKVYRIIGGEATWAGQSLQTCEQQINEWGLRAFLRESQHEVQGAGGYFFNIDQLQTCEPDELPETLRCCRAWDLAATEGGGDWTVGVLMGRHGGRYYVLDVRRGQWGADRVTEEIRRAAEEDGEGVKLRLPQDGGQAGKSQADHFKRQFRDAIIKPVTGDKATRAYGLAEEINKGNVTLLRAGWNRAFTEELRKFRADERDQVDDTVDSASDAYNEIMVRRKSLVAY